MSSEEDDAYSESSSSWLDDDDDETMLGSESVSSPSSSSSPRPTLKRLRRRADAPTTTTTTTTSTKTRGTEKRRNYDPRIVDDSEEVSYVEDDDDDIFAKEEAEVARKEEERKKKAKAKAAAAVETEASTPSPVKRKAKTAASVMAERKAAKKKKKKNKSKRSIDGDNYSMYANVDLLKSESASESSSDGGESTDACDHADTAAEEVHPQTDEERALVAAVVRRVLRGNTASAEVKQYYKTADELRTLEPRQAPTDEEALVMAFLSSPTLPAWQMHLRRVVRSLTSRRTTGDSESDSVWRASVGASGALDERKTRRFSRTNGSDRLFTALEARLFGRGIGDVLDADAKSVFEFFRRNLLAPVRRVFGAREMGGQSTRANFPYLAIDEERIQLVTRAAFSDALSLRYLNGTELAAASYDVLVYYRAHLWGPEFVGERISLDTHRDAVEEYEELQLAVARVTCHLCQRWPARRNIRTASEHALFASVLEVHRVADDDASPEHASSDDDSSDRSTIVRRNAFDRPRPRVTSQMMDAMHEAEVEHAKRDSAVRREERARRRRQLRAWHEENGGDAHITSLATLAQTNAVHKFTAADAENHGFDDSHRTYYFKSGRRDDEVLERMYLCPTCTLRIRRGIRLISYARAWCDVCLRCARDAPLTHRERMAFTSLYMSLLVFTERLCETS